MALTIPWYIADAGIAEAPITYDWDDHDSDRFYLKPDERLRHRIHAISRRGVMALSLGFAEWIAWRLHRYDKVIETVLLPGIEAIWAAVIDWRYLSPKSSPSWEGWSGRVLGPAEGALSLLADVIRLTKRGQFASPESVCLSRLAEHVLHNSESFREWRRFAIDRLAQIHPRQKEDPMGDPVPRQALDLRIEYSSDRAPFLVQEYLRKVDPNQNPYLAKSAEMKKAGFEGTPYS
jgi:hypothetical protein